MHHPFFTDCRLIKKEPNFLEVIMGYNTKYELVVKSGETHTNSCEHPVAPPAKFCPECGVMVQSVHVSDKIEALIAEKYNGFNPFGSYSGCKWYDHEADMKLMSKKFPKTVFALCGFGEESGDIWVKYFRNGKTYKEMARIEYGPFDISLLK
jgi:hypothetical protein